MQDQLLAYFYQNLILIYHISLQSYYSVIPIIYYVLIAMEPIVSLYANVVSQENF
jgi:hypothetical protein